jgi:SAM-dependent methyltransferase/GNAT superfamily N-acetyltransferase
MAKDVSGGTMVIRRSVEADFTEMLAIVNDAARAYRGVIPADRWHDPYMPAEELAAEIADGIVFWVAEQNGRLSGVMGIQDKGDVALVRHAYVATPAQRTGVGTRLLRHVDSLVDKPILIGTWAAASWAIDFYQRNGFTVVPSTDKDRLLRTYWSIPDRQIETSVVLANTRWMETQRRASSGPDVVSVSAGFTGPEYYDACVGPLWFDPFAADLVRRLPKRPPGDVLEIACGTGLVTRRLRRHLEADVRLVATDLSRGMLDYARGKLGADTMIDWCEADAVKLPFGDGVFGVVVCGFGIMFVPDPRGMLDEARRVMMDGGVLVFNVWDRIEENPHAATNAEVLEGLFPGEADMKFRTPYAMHDVGLLRRLLAGARFRETHIETKRIAIEGADPRVMATGQIRGTPRSALIEKRGLSIDPVIEKVAAALSAAGGAPYTGYAQAIIVQAVAS